MYVSDIPPATADIYTLSLHDALPIYPRRRTGGAGLGEGAGVVDVIPAVPVVDVRVVLQIVRSLIVENRHVVHVEDRQSTRLNSSHTLMSYAVFCLRKKSQRHSTVDDH